MISHAHQTTFRRDVEEEEIQYDNTLCLPSSYYSVFVVMLAILIGLLTILTWHINRVYTTRSLNMLAYGLRHELLQRPLLRMWNILNSTVEVATAQVKLSESVIRRYNKPTDQAEQLQLYEVMREVTWALFASRKALNSITLNYRNGFVQAFHRNHRSNNTYYIYSDLGNYSIGGTADVAARPSSHLGWNDQSIHGNISAVWYREPLDPLTGERNGKPTEIPPDELINIAGISQVPDGTATWHIAVSKYTDSPLLAAALPVWNPAHESIVAVVGVTTAFYSVGQLMKELVEFHSGHIYLTFQEGWLLATSTTTPLLMNSTTGRKLVMAVDSEDNIIRSGAECLKKAYGDTFPPGQEVHMENARLGNELYYIDSFFLNLKRLPMVGVVMIPRKYIMGNVDEEAIKTLIILILASVCILFVGCFCIFILTNGVSKEMKLRAALISHLDARRRAEASSNYKSQFLANMSHELRTPMAAVIGLLDILMCDNGLTNEQHAMITQIRKCSTALLRLLNNILDLSKVESGKLILEETDFDLGKELEGLIDMFSVQCINHNIETVLDLSDDMPKVVRGDSGRILQIFANLISNSIKFTTSGYIFLRGWCETPPGDGNTMENSCSRKQKKRKRDANFWKKSPVNDNKTILWFEVSDSGCGIDKNKWESVFESFEQADPSTTRLHGGTGLGLCIVRTLVNKMNGEIKVVQKSEPGTLMKLNLRLSTPANGRKLHYQLKLDEHNFTVLLALNGTKTRLVTTRWLLKNGVDTHEASDWNELTRNLQKLVGSTIYTQSSLIVVSEESVPKSSHMPAFVIVIDIGLLDFSTSTWKQQLKFLDQFYTRGANFAWILNHDTSNGIKAELRERGHFLMVNMPLYKSKMIQIFESIIRGKILQAQKETVSLPTLHAHEQFHELPDIEAVWSDSAICDDSSKSKNQRISCLGTSDREALTCSNKMNLDDMNRDKPLQGLCILLAEDTPVLQRVATIMLEKMGAKVVVVGDGLQAVDALKHKVNECSSGSADEKTKSFSYDLILMDCQMPKMDGYEATKAIRRLELASSSHIPIVALTAHAMSCDEAKCIEVGMDAYLTKPIDRNLMISTILSLTQITT